MPLGGEMLILGVQKHLPTNSELPETIITESKAFFSKKIQYVLTLATM